MSRFFLFAFLGLPAAAWGAFGCSDVVQKGGGGGAGGEGGGDSTWGTTTTWGSSTSSDTTTTTSTTSTTGVGGGGEQPPPPGAGVPGDGPGAVFAIRKFFLGDTNPDGSPNVTNGWKQYGFDLDHRISTNTSTDLCKPNAGGAPAQVYPDGDNGIDNAWGKLILPIVLGLAADAGESLNSNIEAGASTVLIDIEALGSQPSYNPLHARIFDGAQLLGADGFPAPPKWDGTDVWPVRAESLASPPSLDSAKIQLPASYVVSGTWVSGTGDAPVGLTFPLQGFGLKLRIHRPLLAMDLEPNNASASNGTIAGILDTEEMVNAIKQVAGAFDPSLCEGSTIDSIANQLRQASDILIDGSQDPTAICNGISIGLGFEASRVVLGPVAPAQPPIPDPCW